MMHLLALTGVGFTPTSVWATTGDSPAARHAGRHAPGQRPQRPLESGKVVTERWPDPSHAGVNLGFPRNATRGVTEKRDRIRKA